MSVPKTVDVQVPALERALDIVERIAFTSEGISYS